jgi:hypothetical protein
LIVPTEEIVSTYTFRECLTYVYFSDQFFCAALGFTEVYVVPFVPSFSYNYLCTSTLLAAYLPVYIYIYSIQIVVYPLATYLLAKFVPFDRLPPWIKATLPGIIWPHHWLANRSVAGDKDQNKDGCANQSLEISAGQQQSQELASGRTILKTDDLMIKHLQGILVLITFGLCCPPLALTISLSMFLSLLQLRCVIGRFVLLRHPTLVDPHLPSSPFSPPSADSALRALKSGIVNLDRSFHHTAWIVVWSSCFFSVLLCWDIAGDEVGWMHSLWVPGVAVGYLLAVATFMNRPTVAFNRCSTDLPASSPPLASGEGNPILEMTELVPPPSEVSL